MRTTASATLLTAFLLLFQLPSTRPSPIKTVVVLVMENRSFDHMLGWMKRLNPEINGVDGTESNHINASIPGSPLVYFKDGAHFVDPDPGHSFQAMREQIFGSENTSADPAPMNGFAQQANSMGVANMTEAVMNGFNPDMIGVYKALVSEFAVFDRWFAPVPASTQPNRLYVHSGTSGGATSNKPELLIKGYPQRTIFENVEADGLSFGIYYQNIPATLFYRNLRKIKYVKNFILYDLFFKSDAKKGKLPNYTVVEQRYTDTKLFPGNDDHPSHDVYQGQMFVKEVYEALRGSPQWNEMLFLITYDEHGGFFDHVPTPVKGVPSPDGIIGPEPYKFKFDRLGVRVPTIFISPWIDPGTVLHEPSGPFPESQYEHSSIAATVKKIFNLPHFLTKRDEWAGTFEVVLNRTSPRTDCPETLPVPKKLRDAGAKEDAKLNDFQEILVQMAATLNGDHKKETYPHKLVENMTVAEAVKYVEAAFKMFQDECASATDKGADKEEIIEVGKKLSTRRDSRSFVQRLFSCMICDN